MTTAQAAVLLGVTEQHVRWLIAHGRLKYEQYGRNYWITEEQIEEYQRQPKPATGWPAGKKRK